MATASRAYLRERRPQEAHGSEDRLHGSEATTHGDASGQTPRDGVGVPAAEEAAYDVTVAAKVSRAPIRPEVLRWARESIGMTPEEAASAMPGVSESRLLDAESGGTPLTLNQARLAAEVYERPFAMLFLPAPPLEDPVEVQFRRLRDAPELPWPPPMRALARAVPAIQDEADALFEALEAEPKWRDAAAIFERTSEVEQLGSEVRELAEVPLERQKAAARADPQGFRPFRLWREALEEMGVLVLQDGSLPLGHMRGFVSPHPRTPAIVINTADGARARLFTMLHEFAHLFWGTDRPEEDYDAFAAAALMPRRDFARDFEVAVGATLLERVDATARLYGVNPDAAAVRVGWLELAAWEEVHHVRRAIKGRGRGGRGAGGGNYYRNVVARMGPRFVTRVMAAVNENVISELAAARLLGIRVDRFDALRQELRPDAA